jgi:hypothetical protein
MLVLIATQDPHGTLPTDRHFAVDGELVAPAVFECPDAHCDVCARAWFGLVSHAGTTTALVADRPAVTRAKLRQAIHDWLDRQGTIDLVVQAVEDGEFELDGVPIDDPVVAVSRLIDDQIALIEAVCAEFGEGAIVSRMGPLVSQRVRPIAA